DDADHRCCHGLRARRQGRGRFGGPEQRAPGRRLARNRRDGRDRRCLGDRRAGDARGTRGLRNRLPARAPGCRGNCSGGRHSLRGHDSQVPPRARARLRRRVTTTRLPAEERRASLLSIACGLFAGRSYHGTTTAEIARAAGVTEPVLYRHFESKRALYLACMDWSWEQVKELWAERLAAEPDPGLWLQTIGRAFVESEAERPLTSPLWVQALAESAVDPETAAY